MNKIILIGIGMGNSQYITKKAYSILKNNKNIITTERIKNSFEEINYSIKSIKFCEIENYIDNLHDDVVVLVSGDCGFFSLSESITNKFKGKYEIETINGLNSMQYLAARLNSNYNDWKAVSLHGRCDLSFIGKVCYNKKVFIFTGGEFTPQYICNILCEYGMGSFKITVAENLSYDNESIITDIAENIKHMIFKDLNVMLIENDSPCNFFEPLFDCDFIRDKVPMTKENIRWISLNNLKLNPDDILYDIGSGTGSVSIEGARKVYDGLVISIEKEKSAIELIKKNINKHKAFNIKIINDKAPIINMNDYNIPLPNKIFIGGSSGNLLDIFEWIISFEKDIKVVLNCITLETLIEGKSYFKKFNFKNINICCINVSNSQLVGNYNVMKANNAVYILSGDTTNEK